MTNFGANTSFPNESNRPVNRRTHLGERDDANADHIVYWVLRHQCIEYVFNKCLWFIGVHIAKSQSLSVGSFIITSIALVAMAKKDSFLT